MRCEIIYEDGEILVVNKPAGLATQSASVGQADVVSELKGYLAAKEERGAQRGNGPYLGILHRLDQPVEGLLAFAKTPRAAADLTKQLGEGGFNKEYYAVACGKLPASEGELVDYLLKEGGVARVVTGQEKDSPNAKKAVLRYRVVGTVGVPVQEGTEQISFVRIRIETGRFHQIRAQLSHAGAPLLGDRKYGSEISGLVSVQCHVGMVALCAYKLRLRHPLTKKLMDFEVRPSGSIFQMFL